VILGYSQSQNDQEKPQSGLITTEVNVFMDKVKSQIPFLLLGIQESPTRNITVVVSRLGTCQKRLGSLWQP